MMKEKRTLLYFLALTSMSVWANPIGKSKAVEIAADYMVTPGSVPQMVARASNGAKLVAGTTEQNAPLYIFSRGENAGFVIISGDDCLPEVLGYTESGDFVESEMPPALLEWIAGYTQLIQNAQEAGAPSRVLTRQNAPARVKDSWTDISPLVPTHWHQSSPYNDACPRRASDSNSRCATGCVATAASQVMYYWRKECNRYSQYDTPSYQFGYDGCDMESTANVKIAKGTPFQWELMKESYSGSEPSEYRNAVAVMVACLGMSNYLGYGASTAGQIGDLVNTFSGQFGISSTYAGKSGTLSSWENTIYTELAAGRPIIYAGVSASSGGHAVVLDGYRASGTGHFHFNFGWGGQGDGYYTVDDETGMNGFNTSQSMVYQIQPKKYALSAYMLEDDFYYGANNQVRVKVTNNGTLTYTAGFSLYASSSSDMGSAKSTVNEEIPAGESRIVTFEYKPALVKTYRLQVRDGKGSILASASRDAEENTPKLSVSSLSLDASADVVMAGDTAYQQVYNTQATVRATVKNPKGSAPCAPTFKFELLQFSKATGALVKEQTTSVRTYSFEPGTETPIEYTFKYLKDSLNYAIRIQKEYTVGTSKYDFDMPDEEYLYFQAPGKDLTATTAENGVATFTGHWDAAAFQDATEKLEGLTNADLTAVDGVGEIPTIANLPNLLYWCSESSNATGKNVIKNGVCESLYVTKGYDFMPKSSFTARKACFNHRLDSAGIFSTMTMPFDAAVPNHMTARRIESHSTMALKTATVVSTLKANTPYIYLVDCKDAENTLIYANNVTVDPQATADSELDEIMVGTCVTVQTPSECCYMLDDEATQHFKKVELGTTVPALTAYIRNDATSMKNINTIQFSINSCDKQMKLLAAAVGEGFEALDTYYSMKGTEEYTALDEAVTAGDSIIRTFNETTSTASRNLTNSITSCIEALAGLYVGEWDGTDNPWGEEVTSRYFKNPSFESSTSSATGWTTTDAVKTGVYTNSNTTYYTVDTDGNNLFASLAGSVDGAILSQTVQLPAGDYRLSVSVNTEMGSSVNVQFGNEVVTVAGSNLGKHYFVDAVIENLTIEEDSDVTLSFTTTDGQWLRADNVRLYRLSGGAKNTETILGDANGDGVVSVDDINSIAAYLLDNSVAIDEKAADVNGDGVVSIADITSIASMILGE